jgi:hypothetical protein
LEVLSLHSNKLQGVIPTALGDLNSIKQISLTGNQLSGSIPESLGNLRTLTFLSLFSNLLTGTIPVAFGNLSALEGLVLGENELTGTIPLEIYSLTYTFNDTGRHELQFDLKEGANTVISKTDKSCQGEFSELVLVNSIRVYPNPTSDVISILGLKDSTTIKISISNMSGVLVKSCSENSAEAATSIDISNLPQGMYLLRIESTE